MSDDNNQLSPGTRALAHIEHDRELLHILYAADLKPAQDELLNSQNTLQGIVILGRWALDYPTTTSELLSRIAKAPESALKIAPIALGVANHLLEEELDEVLAAAFPRLTGPWRDAAADRPGVRELLGIPDGVGYETVPEPEPSWCWPVGTPFPPAATIEGTQARLNYFERGCGPITGEWNEMTRRALLRWQIDQGLEPTGELDDETVFRLEHEAPKAPD